MDFTFVSRRPPPPLERFTESVWYARGRIDYSSELIAPTGSTVAVIVLGDAMKVTPLGGEPLLTSTGFLIGPHDRPVINEPMGETDCVGVVSTPVGCQALFGISPASLRGKVISLLTQWPAAASIREQLTGHGQPEMMLDMAESSLRRGLSANVTGLDRCETAVKALEADPGQAIGDLAARLGMSHGHLDREFTAIVGLSPRTLSRILRMRALLASLDVYRPVDWTALAARAGWFDQSHFIRDFKRHTGVTPSGYAAAQRGLYTVADAAPGFVPRT